LPSREHHVKKKLNRYLRGFFLALLFGLGTGVLLMVAGGFKEASQALLSFPLAFALGAILLAFARWLVEALVLLLCVHPFGTLPLGYLLNVTFTTQFFNLLTPFYTGGQPFAVYYLSKGGLDVGQATAVVLVKSMVFQSMFSAFALYGVIFSFGWLGKVAWGASLAGLLFNGSVVFLILLFGVNPALARRTVGFFLNLLHRFRLLKDPEKKKHLVMEKVEQFNTAFSGFLRRPGRISLVFLLSALQFSLYIASVLVVLRGAGILWDVQLFTRSLLMITSAAFVPTPGTSGGIEGMYALFFENVGRSANISASMIVWRLCTYYLGIALSGLFTGIFIARSRARKLTT